MIIEKKPVIMFERSSAISLIRFFSMGMIIACHFLQYYENELAWWLNVGVQIFFCVSGFLYGMKDIPDDVSYIVRNSKKVLIDYYILLMILVPVYYIFAADKINVVTVVKVFLCIDTIDGLGHLWFIPYILFCYVITPLLSHIENRLKIKSFLSYLIFIASTVATFKILNYFTIFSGAMVLCYVLSFFFARRMIKEGKAFLRKILILLIPVSISLNALKIINNYLYDFNFVGISLKLYNILIQYSHTVLGLSLFFFLYFILSDINFYKYKIIKRILDFSDKTSFDIYLVHAVYILGPFGFMTMFANKTGSILLVTALILISGVLLKFISDAIKKVVEQPSKRLNLSKS